MEITPEETTPNDMEDMNLFMDLQLAASIRFGETEMLLEEVVKLGIGSVIELNSSIDEPVELVVNGLALARGEVVVVDGFYGIRITELCSGNKRLLTLDA